MITHRLTEEQRESIANRAELESSEMYDHSDGGSV